MTFSEYQERAFAFARKTADLTTRFPIAMWTLGLAGETGELSEKVKKLYRDDLGVVTTVRRDAIAKEAGDVLWYLNSVVTELGLSLTDVAAMNLSKLESRDERGVLLGSGDER